MVPPSLFHSLETVTTNIYVYDERSGRVRGYELRSSVQLVQHLTFRGATWIRCSRILCSRFSVIRYLETISPLVLRAFMRYRPRSLSVACQPEAGTEISPIVTQLQFAIGKGLEDQATFINMTLISWINHVAPILIGNSIIYFQHNACVWIERETLIDLKRCIAMRRIKREISPREISWWEWRFGLHDKRSAR